ncbi:MAG TPA: 2-oxo-4-hydroxy-4-carboxy-5-ureidoimidazoline decarboxylase [Salinisphaeraceae bacterium]|nr:2-oxo-4-hydroxy-4-carboxy-5-ureidoimidazoline decarboxylase [Salinisphaeraceae bacterium]
MRDNKQTLQPAPSRMSEDDFVARFGAIYEHSPWVARAAWQQGPNSEHDTVAGLASLMAAQVEAADEAAQLELMRLHPDLGGRAALAGELTAASAREQAGAGLDACTPEEYERLQQLNSVYQEKFGFPFIIAVAGLQRADILAAMAARLDNDVPQERRTALDEIHKIARLRLAAMTT